MAESTSVGGQDPSLFRWDMLFGFRATSYPFDPMELAPEISTGSEMFEAIQGSLVDIYRQLGR